MDLLPTPEQDEIVSSIRAVIADQHTLGEALTTQLWDTAAAQGWFGLGLGEAAGGVGYSLAEETLLFGELGRSCVPGPFLATVLGARLAAEAGDLELAATIVSGSTRVGLAIPYHVGSHAVLDRTADGRGVDMALLADDESMSLVDLGPAATVTEIPAFDPLVPVVVVGGLATAACHCSAPDPAALHRHGDVLVAAMLAGIAQATTEQSVSYGKDREQFGQPVGGFQAVKHRCADMATRAEVAECQVRYAALALRDGRPDAAFHVHAARTVATNAAIANSQVNVQNHGGIGFTWEHTAHRYVTRSWVLSQCLGTLASHLGAALAASAPL